MLMRKKGTLRTAPSFDIVCPLPSLSLARRCVLTHILTLHHHHHIAENQGLLAKKEVAELLGKDKVRDWPTWTALPYSGGGVVLMVAGNFIAHHTL